MTEIKTISTPAPRGGGNINLYVNTVWGTSWVCIDNNHNKRKTISAPPPWGGGNINLYINTVTGNLTGLHDSCESGPIYSGF